MKLTKRQEAEVMPVYRDWWHSYLNGDVKTYDYYLDDDYRFVGSTEAENFLSRKNTTRFFNATADQLAGKSQLRNSILTAEYYDGIIFFTELADAYLLFGDEWTFYGKFRFSSMLRKNKDGWRFIYQHFSVPDSKAQEGETIGIEQVSKENQELRDAIKRRTAELENKNRELEVEAILEKVRSRSLTVHKVDEFSEVVTLVFEKLNELGIPAYSVTIPVFKQGSKDWDVFGCGESESGPVTLTFSQPYFKHPLMDDILEEHEKFEVGYFSKRYSEKEKNSYYEFNFKNTELRKLPDDVKQRVWESKAYTVSFAYAKHSMICVNDFNGDILTEYQVSILKKFSRVFEQAYIRFLDLQKAEAQTREAQIELSLERIRTQATAMQESSDLLDIVVTMRSEFVKLGHEAHYFWHMRWLPDTYAKAMTSGDGTKIGIVMTLPRSIHGEIKAVADWEKSSEPAHVLAMDADSAVDYVHKMITWGDFEQVDPQAPTLDDVRHIGGLTFIMARTTHGEIGFSLPGVVPEPSKDAIDTLVRFAGVFDLAYKRFEDLKTAEKDLIEIKAAREKAEKALIKLKATQDQLVQQEKLASLGQLTAGIAHEIKNPLNFVNNFSEVSIELIEEVLIELKEIGENEHVDEAKDILSDIESNLRKIHEHGSRADSIVKSMLEHSRGGTGKTEPTDLNKLLKEFVNLSFHGMRASKNPINVALAFNLDESITAVSLIPEDFSRVIINLCNNAFDAMRATETVRLPKLTIRSQKENAYVSIEIEDNGPGIPDDIKGKIMEPFFTTKKGTQGTGLGLSITNDIVKAHGGELKIKSSPGAGTIFKITLEL